MYAVVEDRGKQYKVRTGEEIVVDRLAGNPGATVAFDRVLLLRSPSGTLVGTPTLDGAKVEGTVVAPEKGPKLVSFKLRRRKNSRVKKGHRQHYTRVRITRINAPA